MLSMAVGTIGERVREAREALDMSQAALAKAVGISQQSIDALERGETKKGKHLAEIASALGVHLKWLMSESGPRWDESSTYAQVPGPRSAPDVRKRTQFGDEPTKVAVVGYIGAGAEILPFDDFARGVGMESVEHPSAFVKDCVAVRVRGDSMEPMLRDGWLVFYRRDIEGVDSSYFGRLCVVKVTDGPTLVKTLRRGSRRGLCTLESLNSPIRKDQALDWAAPVVAIHLR